jgi:hypothetical protein
MKKTILLALVLVFSISVFAQNDPTPQQIVENYIKAIGGKTKLESIKDIAISTTGNMQGADIAQNVQHKMPGKFKMTMNITGMGEMVNVTSDGQKITLNMMGQNKVIESGPELEAMKSQNSLFAELGYLNAKVPMTLAGKETINGSPAYKIDFTIGSNHIISFYDVKSGLKVRQVMPGMQGESQTVDLSDYKEVGGVKFPYVTTVATPMGELRMETKSIDINKGIADDVFSTK